MRVVVADANALMMPFDFSINIDSELARLLGSYEIVVPRPILGELKKLAERSASAKAAASLARAKKIIETDSAGDESVIEAAEKNAAIILTNDSELIGIATSKGIKVIRMRGGNRLAFADGNVL